jgi:hypothetical protein
MIVDTSVLRKKMSIDSRVQTKCSRWRALLPGESVYGAQSAFGAPLEDEMAVLEARGLFWWHGEEIRAGLLAIARPQAKLAIDPTGLTLERGAAWEASSA